MEAQHCLGTAGAKEAPTKRWWGAKDRPTSELQRASSTESCSLVSGVAQKIFKVPRLCDRSSQGWVGSTAPRGKAVLPTMLGAGFLLSVFLYK